MSERTKLRYRRLLEAAAALAADKELESAKLPWPLRAFYESHIEHIFQLGFVCGAEWQDEQGTDQ